VVGIEGDASLLDGSFKSGPFAPLIANNGTPVGPGNFLKMSHGDQWLMSIRGRVGFAADNWLVYATGGAPWDSRTFNGAIVSPFNIGSIGTGDVNRTDTGWVAGGGVESAPWHNGLLLRAEYLYYSFNGASFAAPCTRCVPGAFDGPGVFTWSNSHFQVARVGISYKWGGP
jgi:outer membrane immunogenic protein